MTNKLTRVKPFSTKEFLDTHKSEIIVCLKLPFGIYLLGYSLTVLLPAAMVNFFSSAGDGIFWGILCLIFAALTFVLSVRILFLGTVQFLILKSLRSHDFSRTKKATGLRSLQAARRLPLSASSRAVILLRLAWERFA